MRFWWLIPMIDYASDPVKNHWYFEDFEVLAFIGMMIEAWRRT
jgi:hypothetical protein